MSDICITLMVLFVVAVFYYGPRMIVTLSVCLISAYIIEFFCLKLIGQKKHEKYDYSPVITSLIMTLLLSPAVPVWIPVVGMFVALCVAKFPFGGLGCNIFNPAAVGLGFLGICWPELVFKYCEPYSDLGLFAMDFVPKDSLLHTISNGGTPGIQFMNVILGNFPGPAGATPILILVACGIYLLLRKTISFSITFTLFITSSFFALVHQRVRTGTLDSLVYETIAGILIFGTIFMASDPSTIPRTISGRLIFGVLLGAFTMLFRYFGINEFGFIYALLITNALSDFCDVYGKKLKKLFFDILNLARMKIKQFNLNE